jgi:hypothetical protein
MSPINDKGMGNLSNGKSPIDNDIPEKQIRDAVMRTAELSNPWIKRKNKKKNK